MKLHKCGEWAFLLGVILLGLATTLMSKAGFGLSMVVAPAYVMAEMQSFISTGTMCYVYQGILVAVTSLMMRRFKIGYLFTFISAVLFGLSVDFFTQLCFFWIVEPTLWQRLVLFVIGIPINSFAISLLFHTYFPPQAPELFVKEFAAKFGKKVHRVKYVYDLCSCAASIIMSLVFLHRLMFVGVGTVICALVNAPLIGVFGRILDGLADYEPMFPRVAALFEKK